MTSYINELLQEVLGNKNDYMKLAKSIYNYINNNDESKYQYIIDVIQIEILKYTDKFLTYQDCEDLYLAIKGAESVYNND